MCIALKGKKSYSKGFEKLRNLEAFFFFGSLPFMKCKAPWGNELLNYAWMSYLLIEAEIAPN